MGRVVAKFDALAADLLADVRKTEDSLRRLKKLRQGAGGGAGAAAAREKASDADKICVQLMLDARAMGTEVVRDFLQDAHGGGGDAPYVHLATLCAPFAQLLKTVDTPLLE